MVNYVLIRLWLITAENDYRISYGLLMPQKGKSHELYIFINQTFWKLLFTDNADDNQKTLALISEEGQQSNWFGDKYSIAFCVQFGDHCKTALINVRNISFVEINYIFRVKLLD